MIYFWKLSKTKKAAEVIIFFHQVTLTFKVVNFSSKQNTESEKQALFPRPPNTTPYIYTSVPVEVVITSGGISLTLYNMEDERNSSRYKSKKRRVSKKVGFIDLSDCFVDKIS